MRKVVGICCILLGIGCLLSSVGLIVYNRWEEENARAASQNMLQDIKENIKDDDPSKRTDEISDGTVSADISEEIPQEMLTTQVSGYDCIGVLSIPVLELELPVLTDWSYAKLKIAPCHYFGSCYERDFVIAAHNYPSHFGRLSELLPEDLILFTDVSGTVHCYEVVLLETLPANATEEMITSGFDLSLYTCTPGGANRVTVRCNTIDQS